MGKFLLPLDKIDSEDSFLVTKKVKLFSALAALGINLPKSLVLTNLLFHECYSLSEEKINSLVLREKTSSPQLIIELKNLLRKQVVLPKNFVKELHRSLPKNFDYLAVFTSAESENLNLSSLQTFAKKSNLEEVLLAAFTFPFEDKLIKDLDTFNQLKVCVTITPSFSSEISGKLKTKDKTSYEIFSQWGEFDSHLPFDRVSVKKTAFDEIRYDATTQSEQIIINNGFFKKIPVAKKYQQQEKLNVNEIKNLAKIALKLESHFLTPIEFHFSLSGKKLVITDFEIGTDTLQNDSNKLLINLPLLGSLKPAFPGLVTGALRQINNVKELNKIRHGEILSLKTIDKRYLTALKKAGGLIVQKALPLEMRSRISIPTVVGEIPKIANQLLTVSGNDGKVYSGAFSSDFPLVLERKKVTQEEIKLKTATKIFATLENLHDWHSVSEAYFQGLGPIRGEIFFSTLKKHPLSLFKDKKEATSFVETSAAILNKYCELAKEDSVIYQASDFRHNQLLNLTDGQIFENDGFALMGERGASRHLAQPDILRTEIEIIKAVRNKFAKKNLWLALPFVRTKSELASLKKFLASNGLSRTPSLKILVSLEVPANVFQLEEFLSLGIDGFIINYSEVANFAYAKDLTHQELLYFEDDAIEKIVEQILFFSRKNKLFSLLTGYPLEATNSVLKKVVELGIKAVAIHPNLTDNLQKRLAKEEKDLINSK